jgi:two-component system CheB/CheR fusion protein
MPASNRISPSQLPDFPIVGIGASAGGLEAVKSFLGGVPEEPNVAFVLVMHLSPDRESHLAELLQSATSMPVTTVTEETKLESGHFYVVAPRSVLQLEAGFRVVPGVPPDRDGAYHPIDRFFRSLAEQAGPRGVGVVLSGSGTDGSQGVREINQKNGFVLVQDPEEAAFPSMPRAAIRAVPPDLVGTAHALGDQLSDTLDASGKLELPHHSEDLLGEDVDRYHRLLTRLKSHSGHDFGSYKSPTLLRRIGRRVQIKGLTSLAAYLDYVREHPEELSTLYQDLLIPVTSFSRDPDVFEYVRTTIIPQLFENRESSESIRVWIPACSTGEEAYSYALLLNEYAARRSSAPDIRLFATDVNERAIETAREGVYPETISEDVDDHLLNRYFGREDHGYVVKPEIRDQIVFAHHDLLSDPPFAHLDLVSCRNLLIYLRPDKQKRVLKIVHFALRSSGWMVLGSAESAEVGSELFRAVDRELSV